jgi:hypothetical protein
MRGSTMVSQKRLRRLAKSLQLVRNRRNSLARRKVAETRAMGRKACPVVVER